ncbi:MAG: hypothetical protein PHP44_10175, partial [Kiritimatiellae bacterium]|nr:hypothetical protein [Kiritimatiellia bacterium]
MTPKEFNLGEQPLDGILRERHIQNHDLVNSSTEQITHKMVQKARKGRRPTTRVQLKIRHALHALLPEE